jgi:hypothetical protein
MHAHAHTQARTHAHTHMHTHTCTHTCTHARTHMHTHTHARTRTRTHMHTHAHTCTHTHTHTHAHTRARAHTLTHAHTRTHTHRGCGRRAPSSSGNARCSYSLTKRKRPLSVSSRCPHPPPLHSGIFPTLIFHLTVSKWKPQLKHCRVISINMKQKGAELICMPKGSTECSRSFNRSRAQPFHH